MHSWRRWLRAALMVWREEGAAGIARYAGRRLYLRQGFFLYERTLSGSEAITLPASLTSVRLATSAERKALAQARESFEAASYWEMVQPDAECYLGFDGNNIVSVHWMSTIEESNGLVELAPGDFVIGPCVTISTHRGRGVYPAMIRALCDDRYRKGQRRAYMVVNFDNSPSIRGIEKAGFKCTGRADLRRLLGFQRVTRRPVEA